MAHNATSTYASLNSYLESHTKLRLQVCQTQFLARLSWVACALPPSPVSQPGGLISGTLCRILQIIIPAISIFTANLLVIIICK